MNIFHKKPIWTRITDHATDKLAKLSAKIEKQKKIITETDEITIPSLPETPAKDTQTIEFSLPSVFKVMLLILAMIWLASIFTQISNIFILIFVSLIFAATFDPWVDWLQSHKIPRAIGILIIYLSIGGLISILIAYYLPILIDQIFALSQMANQYLTKITSSEVLKFPFHTQLQPIINSFLDTPQKQTEILLKFQNQLVGVGDSLLTATGSVFTFISSIFGGVFSAATVLILTFYMVLEDNAIERFIASMFASKHQKYVEKQMEALKIKMGGWMRGQILLMILMGSTVWIGLRIAQVPYAATLALLAGFMELIPYVGAIVTLVPAVIFGWIQSPLIGLGALIAILGAQMIEGNIYLPLVMRRAVGLSPVITIIAMLIGAQLIGIGGVILAVPVASLISVFVNDYTARNKKD